MHRSPSLPPWLSSTFTPLSPTLSCVLLCFSFYFPYFFFIHLSDVTQDKSPHMQKHKITLASFHLQILWVRNSGSTRGGRSLPHHVEGAETQLDLSAIHSRVLGCFLTARGCQGMWAPRASVAAHMARDFSPQK